ncbi:hypothetical protein BO78DRAFT_398461 [Aspergillus sclerotiicarbonarius CBS 121057]|uniref:Uncharacterized protein n=1 Tax=Aspergillus sclerotiicarbonarius (strain CBS 121057 / IBT 28362) TaxID=1448318 RepID=A0A319FEI1_ASPSB|nr:hypothetical protein BO78DRAFT_398461 [Aspergillus sclerotiicarbonarius CBS 121057]
MVFYAHLQQRQPGKWPGHWHRYLVTATDATEAKRFYIGLKKYTHTSNPTLKHIEAENLEWWNFESDDGWCIKNIYTSINEQKPSEYNNVQELTDCRKTILLTLLHDHDGRVWPILPCQSEQCAQHLDIK